MKLCNTQSKSDWLFDTESRVLPADWLTLENSEKATLKLKCPVARRIVQCILSGLLCFVDRGR